MSQNHGRLRQSILMFWAVFLVFMLSGNLLVSANPDPVGFWKMDEGTGILVADSSGNDNDGTIVNMSSPACWVNGYSDSGLDFDGTDGYISLDCAVDIGTTHTVSAWLYASDLSYYEAVLGYSDDTYMTPLMLRNVSGNTCVYYHDGSTYKSVDLGEDISGSWKNIMVVRNGLDVSFYLDDILKGSVSLDDNTAMYVDMIGARQGAGAGFFFEGIIDEVQVYDGFRPAGYWKFNEDTGTAAADSSGNGNDGTLINMSSPACWFDGRVNSDGCFHNVLDFDGTNDYVSLDSVINIGTVHTVCTWVYAQDLSYYEALFGYTSDSYMTPLMLKNSSGSTCIYYHDGSVYQSLDLGEDISGEWKHVAVVRNGLSVDFYLDGESKGSVTLAADTTMYVDVIGARRGSSALGFFFEGMVDEVQIYKEAYSAGEIASMYFNLLSAYTERNYYTSESSAVIVCDLEMPLNELSGCYLTAKSGTTTLGTNTTPEDGTDLDCSISGLSNGSNTITVELRCDSGELVLARDVELVKRAAKAGYETKIDRHHGIVLRDGTGFFPIGIHMGNVSSDGTTHFETVSQAGFNSILRWNGGVDPSDATTYLENAADATSTANPDGLLVMDRLASYATISFIAYKHDPDFWDYYVDERDNLISAVSYARQEENLIGYYSFDEPSSCQLVSGQDLYSRTNSEDGYHPTLATYATVIPPGDDYTNWCDILSVDVYWTPPVASGQETSTSVNTVSKYVYLARERARQDHKALWIVLMSEYWSLCRKRAINAAEQRCQTYLALIHGAKGIFYYRYPKFLHNDTWNTMLDLTDEMDELAPAILMPDIEQSVTYSSGTLDPENDQFPDVQLSLRQAPASESYDYVLLVANTKAYSVEVDYTVSLLGGSGTVSRLFGTATYSVSNGEFSDTLAAFDTRAYTFTSSSTSSVSIAVDMTPGTAPEAEAAAYPDSGRPDKTNLMQNPSLEDNTVTNWPDYLMPYNALPRINAANQAWGLEGTGAYDGSKCLKITNSGSYNGAKFYLSPEHSDPSGKDYTFSVYMKTDAAGVAAGGLDVVIGGTPLDTLDAEDDAPYSVVVDSTSWTRYDFTVNIPDDLDPLNYFYIRLDDQGSIWVDAIQVEQSSSPTTFTTD